MNKTVVVIFLLLMIAGQNLAQAQINFVRDKGLEQALAEAKAKKRIVFVDVYATWCGPCKWMDENTFKDSRLIDKFNRQFFNLKIDGDTPEGQKIRNQYKIGISYPTYLFFSSDGKLLHRIEGMVPVGVLMDEADFASRKARGN